MRLRRHVLAIVFFTTVGAALFGGGKDNPVRPTQFTLISNLDQPGTGYLSLDSLHQSVAAVGFRAPAADYQLNYTTLRLLLPLGSTSGVHFSLYDADTAGNPNQQLTTLRSMGSQFSNSAQNISFAPLSPIVLHANQTYWIVGYCNVGPSILGPRTWPCGPAPTGLATHIGSKYEQYVQPNPPSADTTLIGKYAVVATHL